MSVQTETSGTAIPSPIDTTIPEATLQTLSPALHKPKKSKKKKPLYPINPVSFNDDEEEDDDPPSSDESLSEPESDATATPTTPVTPATPNSKFDRPSTGRILRPSHAKRKKKKKKSTKTPTALHSGARKSITSLDDVPKFPKSKSSRKASELVLCDTPKSPMTKKKKCKTKESKSNKLKKKKTKPIKSSTPCKVSTQRRKKKARRTNSSMVYSFNLNNDGDHGSASDSEASNITPIGPIRNLTQLPLTKDKDGKTKNKRKKRWTSTSQPRLNRTPTRNTRMMKKTMKRKAKLRASSVGVDNDENMDVDGNHVGTFANNSYEDSVSVALMKRLKAENKELRKSRNRLRKDHDVLQKIESKLRHKLEIIVKKFRNVASMDDTNDWHKLQTKGDIEGILDAVFARFVKITDQFVENESVWKLQREKWKRLEKEWKAFQSLLSTTHPHEDDTHHSDALGVELDRMFDVLMDAWEDLQSKADRVEEQDEELKTQQGELDALEEELLRVRNNEQQLKEERQHYIQLQSEYALLQQEFEEYKKHTQDQESEYKSEIKKCKTMIDKLKAEKQEFLAMKEEFIHTKQTLTDTQDQLDALQQEFRVTYKHNKKLEGEVLCLQQSKQSIQSQLEVLEEKQEEYEARMSQRNECGTQTQFAFVLKDEEMLALQSENCQLMQELNFLISERSRFKPCKDDRDYHRGDVACIVVCPNSYKVVSCGKDDHTLRIWEPKPSNTQNNTVSSHSTSNIHSRGTNHETDDDDSSDSDMGYGSDDNETVMHTRNKSLSGTRCRRRRRPTHSRSSASTNLGSTTATYSNEILFVPKHKAFIDGTVLNVNMSEDGALLAAGATLKDSVEGYVVVWNMQGNKEKCGTVLCNLRSRTRMRFGKVHCVQMMKYEQTKKSKRGHKYKHSKHKNKAKDEDQCVEYLLFAGDTTGCILCWNLYNEETRSCPVAVINGHSDIIYDMCIVNNEWLFSVSHDQCLSYVRIVGLEQYDESKAKSKEQQFGYDDQVQHLFSAKLFKDDSKYPLKSVVYNEFSNELVFGSRKCNMFRLNDEMEMEEKEYNKDKRYFVSKCGLNCKDLDHIAKLKLRDNLMMMQRSGTNYVKLFNLTLNKLVKMYQIDDANSRRDMTRKYKLYDCGITYDMQYAVLCVGIKEQHTMQFNRSALKGFRIPAEH